MGTEIHWLVIRLSPTDLEVRLYTQVPAQPDTLLPPLARTCAGLTLGLILALGLLAWPARARPQGVMDLHEVTVGQFRQFAQATGLVTQAERDGGGMVYAMGWEQRRGWTWKAPFGRPAADDEPAVHITFDEAQAACQFMGKRLPTDREWTQAAYLEQRANPPAPFVRGQRFPYPNGLQARGSHCLQGCAERRGLAPEGALDRGTGHVAVKTTVPGVNGLYDMGGNVWEWVDGGEGSQRITRGGSWWYGPERQREDDVATKPRDTRVVYIGFRCFKP